MNDIEIRNAEDERRGRRAAELLGDEVLQEALNAIEAEVISKWADCPARDKEGKEALWQLYKTAQKFRGVLSGYVRSGQLATERLKEYDKPSAIRRLFGT